MDLTPEVLNEAVTAKPENKAVLADFVKNLGFRVIDEANYNTFLETERANIAPDITSRIYTGLDNDIAAVAGFGKEGTEKTYDFAKRAVTTYKAKAEQLEAKTKELEKKIAEGSTDPTLKAQLETYQNEKAQWEETRNGYEQKLFEQAVSFEANKGLMGFKVKPGIPESVANTYLATMTDKLIKSAKKTESGQIIYLDEKGNTILKNDMQPADASYILKDWLKDIADVGVQQQGAGTGGSPDTTRADGGSVVIPESIKSKQEVTQFLMKAGILRGTQEHEKMYADFINKHPNLPLA